MNRSVILFSLLCLASLPLRSQNLEDLAEKNYLAVGLSGGYYIPVGDYGKESQGNAGPGPRIDLFLGATFYKVFQLRLELDSETHGENKSVPGTNKATLKSSTLTLRYYFLVRKFKPFVYAGGGFADLKVKSPGGDGNKSMACYLGGAGFEWNLTKNVGLDLSANYRFTPSKNAKFDFGNFKSKLGYNANSMGVGLGAFYRFSLGSLL